MLYLLVTIVVFFISYYFFSIASGTMRLREINATSFVFYYQLLLYSVMGSVIIVNNLDYSAWFRYINLNQEVRIYGWLAILYTTIMLPIGMILANKIHSVNNMYSFFSQYRLKSIEPFLSNKDSYIFFGLFFLSLLSIFGVFYTFLVIGKIPFFEIFKAATAWDLARLRMEAKTEFAGNTYIRQVFGLMLTPLLSYIYYLYYKLYGKRRFYYLFLSFLFLSFLMLTYN